MSQTVMVRPMEWASLDDIENVDPLGDGDAECLSEVHAVLKRHGMDKRFGVTLLHKHFPLEADEVLLERTDTADRRLELRPAKVGSPEVGRSVQTSWMLTDAGTATNTACLRRCVRNIHGNHEMGPHVWS